MGRKSKETKRKELAIKRLEYLKKKYFIPCNIVEHYKEGILYYGDRTPLGGILYYLDDTVPQEVRDAIEYVKGHNGEVFLATHEYSNYGEWWDLWVITDEDVEETWREEEFEENNIVFSYVVNRDIPEFSEYGSIQYDFVAGGPIRL